MRVASFLLVALVTAQIENQELIPATEPTLSSRQGLSDGVLLSTSATLLPPPSNGILIPDKPNAESVAYNHFLDDVTSKMHLKSTIRSTTSLKSLNSLTAKAKSDEREKVANPFKNIFYINMDGRPDRKTRMEDQLKEYTTQFQRFPAVELSSYESPPSNSDLANVFAEYVSHRDFTNDLLKAPAPLKTFISSVYLSHVAIMEQILKEGTGEGADLDAKYLILEDDAVLNRGWMDSFNSVLSELPPDWDLLRIGTWGAMRPSDRVSPNVSKAVAPFKEHGHIYYAGMHAVVVRPRTLPNVLRLLKEHPITDIDEMVTVCCSDLKSYVVRDNLIGVFDLSGSESNHPNFQWEKHASS